MLTDTENFSIFLPEALQWKVQLLMEASKTWCEWGVCDGWLTAPVLPFFLRKQPSRTLSWLSPSPSLLRRTPRHRFPCVDEWHDVYVFIKKQTSFWKCCKCGRLTCWSWWWKQSLAAPRQRRSPGSCLLCWWLWKSWWCVRSVTSPRSPPSRWPPPPEILIQLSFHRPSIYFKWDKDLENFLDLNSRRCTTAPLEFQPTCQVAVQLQHPHSLIVCLVWICKIISVYFSVQCMCN